MQGERTTSEKKEKRQFTPLRAKSAADSGVPPLVLRLDGVVARTGLAGSTVLLKEKTDPQFPKSFPIAGTRARGWLASEVDGYVLEQIRRVRGGEPVAA